jgi:hypothetical protein
LLRQNTATADRLSVNTAVAVVDTVNGRHVASPEIADCLQACFVLVRQGGREAFLDDMLEMEFIPTLFEATFSDDEGKFV